MAWDSVIEDFGNGNMFTSMGALNFLDGKGNYFNMNNESSHLRAYKECAPLKAIIGKRAKAFNNGTLSINDKTGKPTKNAGVLTILDKLNNPNPLQTRRQFLAQMNSYIDLFGYCPLFVMTPVGRPDVITSIWCIPLWLFDMEYTRNWLFETSVTGIFTNFKSGTINLPAENIKLIFDDGFGSDLDCGFLIPDSRLKGLDNDVSNIVAANKSNFNILSKGRPMGILSNESKDESGSIPLKKSEYDALQADFKRYGVVGQEWQVIIAQSNLKWQSMGYPVKDMLLQETINGAIMRLCDAYSINYQLLSSEKSASYNDVKEFKKDFYQDGIIPESISRWEQLTKALLPVGYSFYIDYSHVPALQADMQSLSIAVENTGKTLEREFKNNVITLNMWLIRTDQEERTDTFGSMYYYQLLALGWTFGNTTVSGGDNLPAGGAQPAPVN